jgi:protein ATS1
LHARIENLKKGEVPKNHDEILSSHRPSFPLMAKEFKLFALGSNGRGKLGIGHENDAATPQMCIFDDQDVKSIGKEERILKIVAGGNHTIILFKSGAIFAAGSNECGQCNLPSRIAQISIFKRVVVGDSYDPNPTSGAPRFVDVSATWEATFLLDTKGRVFSFGTGLKGELGRGNRLTVTGEIHDTPLPAFGNANSKIMRLYSGMRHSIAINNDGEVYGWGSCRKGELGADLQHRKEVWSPKKLSVPFQCREAAVGRNFTIICGLAACQILGQDQELHGIAELEHTPFEAIDAGWSTAYSFVNKRVQAFGRNDRGQFPSDDLPDLSEFAAGSEHCLGLTSTGQALAWGWSEHGNCGQPTDSRGNVANRWNLLTVPLDGDEVVLDVAAGCATSFIIVGQKPA